MYVNPLVAQELSTGSTMLSAAPVTPIQGSRTDLERMEQNTDPAWFSRHISTPLALLA
jgi:hypothetical protein